MPKITHVTAFIVEETPGDESIPGVRTPAGWLPLIGGDQANIDSKRQMAQMLANATGKQLTIVRFTVREVMGVVLPEGAPDEAA